MASLRSTGTFLGIEGVPRMGLGLAALGRPGYINLAHGQDVRVKTVQGMLEHSHEVMDEAHALGIR